MLLEQRTRSLSWCYAPWSDYPANRQTAVARLLRLPYLRMAFPTDEEFAAEFAVPAGSSAFRETWGDLLRRCEAALAGAYAPDDTLYTLFAHSAGGVPIAVATMATGHSRRDVRVAEAIGDPASAIPTLRMLLFHCGSEAGLDLNTIPERRVREFMRLRVMQPDELARLRAGGVLTAEEVRHVAQHGLDEMLAGSFFCGQALGTPPAAFIYNVKPRLARALARKGLGVRPLFLGGAEPSPRVLSGGPFSRRYFDWTKELSRVLPPGLGAQDTREAIRFLANECPDLLDGLAISLPYLFVNDAALAEAMARLAARCGLTPRVVRPSDQVTIGGEWQSLALDQVHHYG